MASSAADPPVAEIAERLVRRERMVTLAGVAALVLSAWAWLAMGAQMSMSASFAAVTAMWAVMMVAMMLPSGTPAILLYARVKRSRGDATVAPTWLFVAGYVIAWIGFSVAAAAAQLALVASGAVGAMALRITLPELAGAALIVAGTYQLSPWKDACLSQCRSPAGFISRHWRPGAAGAVRLGLLHGAICVGCCWLLMALLFVGGVMNLAWVALLSALVAVEKIVPRGAAIGRAAGIVMIAAGVALIVAG
ncbi:MAG: DUF2182 domain-containing protein [Sphingomicrobium sp.]